MRKVPRLPIPRLNLSSAVLLICVVVTLPSCGSSDDENDPTTNGQPSAATTPGSSAASAIEGVWRTNALSVDDLVQTLREHRLGRWARRFETNSPISGSGTSLVLEIRDGRWDLFGEPRGGAREEIDYDARFEVDGNNVVVSHEGDSNTYRWSVNGDALKLTWLATTYPSHEGVPEKVFQRALYMTESFRRAR